MKRFLSFLLIMMMTILVACGNADTADEATDTSDDSITDTTNDTNASDSSAVTYTITGATEATVTANSFNFFCDDGDGVFEQFYEVSVLADSQQLGLSLQLDVAGTVALIGSDDDGANPGAANYVDYRDADLTNYQLGTGELVIEAFPSAAGESFIATLTAELADDDGNTVTIEASFDNTVGNSAFEDCTTSD
ncbi:MAG: hypothetical protein WBC91_18485 [Phototrophicaceae bacterium]